MGMMMIMKSLIETAEMNDRKRWNLLRKIKAVESRNGALPEIADDQSNALGIAQMEIDIAIKKIYGQSAEYRALMQQIYTEEKAAFPRTNK